jgi:hypothetical protein
MMMTMMKVTIIMMMMTMTTMAMMTKCRAGFCPLFLVANLTKVG